MMEKILVLFAHPKFERSRVNKVLVGGLSDLEGVTFHDLYEAYPDFNINLTREKELLENHDVILWHHPLYWYSCPPLLKQWIDVVLEYKWAYGPSGTALVGKKAMNVITAGGSNEVYCSEGRNHYTINEFLRPFEQTARLCGMKYLPPFAVMGTHRLAEEKIEAYAVQYKRALRLLSQGVEEQSVRNCFFFNELSALTLDQ